MRSSVSIKTLQKNVCLAFHIPSLVWDLDEKVRKLPDLTDKTDIFCQKGNVSLTSGWHLNICLFLSPRVLLSQLLGGRPPGKRIYFSFFVLFSLVINTKRACMELWPGT